MDSQPRLISDDPTHFPWDFNFNFNFENLLDLHSDVAFPPPNPPPPVDDPTRTRDPRIFCSNFLAGRVPCSCPEIDIMMKEEEEEEEDEEEQHVGSGKKRGRRCRARAGPGMIRCQVPGCEVDISQLKGYHKRHKVCLCCANSGSVLLDGEFKRYCQQCGKFHVLSDFDEGRRSCRRKLERHNRRRRKPGESGSGAHRKESHHNAHVEEAAKNDPWSRGDIISLNSLLDAKAAALEPDDGHPSVSSFPMSHNFANESILSSMPAQDFVTDRGKDNPKSSHSPSNCDDKSAYSSVCPTGRISFKLYDWNPAEFPRHLRHQIFQWLANMPVELEGYIRPGCTILTVFVAMPTVMWRKLFKDPVSYLHSFIVEPGRLLSGRGPVRIYLEDMIFHVAEDTSVVKIEAERKVPRLHNVHPVYFEAGKPMEFFACGSNLHQPNTRFLISFGGKYVKHNSSAISSNDWIERSLKGTFDHQTYKIHTTHTVPNLFGPAFIEVENECGLSNFIPVLIGNKEICAEIKMIEEKIDASFSTKELLSDVTSEEFLSRQRPIHDFIVDIGWLLKEPMTENLHQLFSPSQMQRFTSILDFLIQNKAVTILENALRSLKVLISSVEEGIAKDRFYFNDMLLLKERMFQAEEYLRIKPPTKASSKLYSEFCGQKRHFGHQSNNQNGVPAELSNTDQDLEKGESHYSGISNLAAPLVSVPLLNADAVLSRNLYMMYQTSSLLSTVLKSRLTLYVIAGAAACLGLCSTLHPQKIGEFAASVHRSLFDRP